MKKTLLAATVVVAALAALLAVAMRRTPPLAVEVAAVGVRDLRPAVAASGRIIHGNEVRLTSEVVGKVEAVYVEEGAAVAAGDLVLAIDDKAFAARVSESRAAVRLRQIDIERKQLAIETLRRKYERNRRLFDIGLLEQGAFDEVAHRYRAAGIDLDSSRELLAQAKANLAQSTEQLEKTKVVSPIAGMVTALDIEVGETAIASTTNVPGSGLMVIADPASLLTEVYVDEADIADVRVGQAAQVVAVAYPNSPLSGTVEYVAGTARQHSDRRGPSFRVRIRLHRGEGEPRLLSGMSCRAEIFLTDGEPLTVVPIRAIVSREDAALKAVHHLYVVSAAAEGGEVAGPVRKVQVELGRSDVEYQEILAGPAIGDYVVAGPARTLRYLRDGQAVVAAAPGGAAPAGESQGA